ncbi:MAG TPA: hypothetical protein VK168_18885 [Saprospiraceae bacterium]|nr:hypothetical protein [Saprospiraceae bacterium]
MEAEKKGQHPDRITMLEQQLAECQQRSQRYESAWSELFDQQKTLREETLQLQHGYENLRIQKGGFGFKMLLFSGLGGFFTALVLCFLYLKIKPKDPHTSALQHFKREHLFEYELALSKGQFQEVKTSLESAMQKAENQPIKTDLEIIRELLEAAEKGR